jgi:hypothetical protein
MKELLTRSFWQRVKKTFYEALEEPPTEGSAAAALQTMTPSESNTEGKPNEASTSAAPSSPSATTEQV